MLAEHVDIFPADERPSTRGATRYQAAATVGRAMRLGASPSGQSSFRAAASSSMMLPPSNTVEPTEEMLQSLFATGETYGFEFLGPLPEQAH